MLSSALRTVARSALGSLRPASAVLVARAAARPAAAHAARLFSSPPARRAQAEFAPRRRDDGPTNPPSNTLYIGNLPFSSDEDELRHIFESFAGLVRVRIALHADGRPRGFGHVEFSSVDAATAASADLLREPLFIQDRQVRVDYAPPRTESGNPPYHKLFVTDFAGTETELHEAFDEFAETVVNVFLLKDRETGQPFGRGFVEFRTVGDATKALNALRGSTAKNGSRLLLNYARPKAPREDSRGGRGGEDGRRGGNPNSFGGRGRQDRGDRYSGDDGY